MYFNFKKPSFSIVFFALLLGFSCSDDATTPTIKTQAVFEHTFNCTPQYGASGPNVDMYHMLNIATAPEIIALDEKITAITIDSIKYSFAIPDEELYEVVCGFVSGCPITPGQTASCYSPLITPGLGSCFYEFYNGSEGFVYFENDELAKFEKSLFEQNLLSLSVVFNFDSNNQGYPIDSFDLTFEIFATIQSVE